MQRGAIGVDIGGTKIAAGLVTPEGAVSDRVQVETPRDSGEAATRAVVRALEEVAAGRHLPVGVGAAGLVDNDGVVRYAPNLPWRDHPLRVELEHHFGRAVTVDNDANAAAWGEFRAGAGKGAKRTALMLTIGTGVGGGLIVDERLARGANGFGGEFGHVVVSDGGRECPCGNRGCLEALASGTAIGRTAQEWLEAGDVPADSALHDLPEITGASVGRVARQGDATAAAAVAECGR